MQKNFVCHSGICVCATTHYIKLRPVRITRTPSTLVLISESPMSISSLWRGNMLTLGTMDPSGCQWQIGFTSRSRSRCVQATGIAYTRAHVLILMIGIDSNWKFVNEGSEHSLCYVAHSSLPLAALSLWSQPTVSWYPLRKRVILCAPHVLLDTSKAIYELIRSIKLNSVEADISKGELVHSLWM